MGICASSAPAPSEKSEAGAVVVQIVGATNVPWMDLLSPSDCFVKMDIVNAASGRVYDQCARTLTLEDTTAPTWGRTFLALPVHCEVHPAGDVLRLQIWDEDLPKRAAVADDLVAEGQVPLASLLDGAEHSISLTMKTTKRKGLAADAPASTIMVRLIAPLGAAAAPTEGRGQRGGAVVKTLFLIRHGESVWNEGEQKKNVAQMAGFDHPLSSEGVAQALRFNAAWCGADDATTRVAEPACAAFFDSPTIVVSPLTRALQTALITLSGHPTLVARGATLTASMREVKNRVTSLDTVGIEVGSEKIHARAIAEMQAEGGKLTLDGSAAGLEAARWARVQREAAAVALDANDAAGPGPWWTPKSEADANSEALNHRMADWFTTIRFAPTANVVCVGHSLFFREVLRRCMGDAFVAANSERAAQLKKCKMANAGCLRVQLYFPPIDIQPAALGVKKGPSAPSALGSTPGTPGSSPSRLSIDGVVAKGVTAMARKKEAVYYECPVPSVLTVVRACFFVHFSLSLGSAKRNGGDRPLSPPSHVLEYSSSFPSLIPSRTTTLLLRRRASDQRSKVSTKSSAAHTRLTSGSTRTCFPRRSRYCSLRF